MLVSFVLAGACMLGLKFGVGADFDSPTIALAVACVVMIWALRAMWGIVVALARPGVETILVEAESVGPGGRQRSDLAELREDKRRVLRAIKELEFDHAMRKLSDEDFSESATATGCGRSRSSARSSRSRAATSCTRCWPSTSRRSA